MPERDRFYHWFEQLEQSAGGQHVSFPPAPSPAQAFAAIAIQQCLKRPVLWIVENERALVQALRDLHALQPAADTSHLPFPPAYGATMTGQHTDLDGTGTRLQTLHRIGEMRQAQQAPIVVAPVAACNQPTISPTQIRKRSCQIAIGSTAALESVRQFLEQNGYEHEAEVLEKGQYAGRGGILDVWPADTDFPLRLEWFGDEIESLRFFDPITQRTVEKTATVLLSPLQDIEGATGTLLDHIPDAAAIIWYDYQHAMESMDTENESPVPRNLSAFTKSAAKTRRLDFGSLTPDDNLPAFKVLDQAVHLPATSGTAQLAEGRLKFLDYLMTSRKCGWHIRLYFETIGTRDHFLHHLMPQKTQSFEIEIGCLSEGFACPAIRTIYAAESDLYGRKRFPAQTETVSKKAKRYAGSRINDFTDMEPGDLVVHSEHGVGRYLGVQQIQFNHKTEEVLAIEYAEEAKLYVPVAHAHLLSRYVGMAGNATSLHRLGGKRWARE
ncbi:MAG: CarD family transcriptional regulator, partial [Kiritimatiellia bacterium]